MIGTYGQTIGTYAQSIGAYRGGGGDLAGAKFGTAKCGTAKLYHILPWYLRTEAAFFPLPDLCTFSLHYNPGQWELVLAKNDFTLYPVSQMVHDGSRLLSW